MNWNTSSGLEIGLVVGLVMVFYSPVVGWFVLTFRFIQTVFNHLINCGIHRATIFLAKLS